MEAVPAAHVASRCDGDADARAYYATPSAVTDLRRHAGRLRRLPTALPELRRIAHGLIVHPVHAHRYGIAPADLRADDVRLHGAAQMLDRILELDDADVMQARPPHRRMAGNCSHVAILSVALFRHLGIPARARVGFCNYYLHGRSHDHSVVEVWSPERERWILVDPLLDDVLGKDPDYPIDLLDVSRERFWVAGQAWQRCRAGHANPWTFGYRGLWGLWYVRSNLLRDLASINKVELLPGDVWALSEKPDDELQPWELSLLDVTATSTQRTDPGGFAACRTLYDTTAPLQPPQIIRRWVGDNSELVDLAAVA
jgi:hypothetical protein